MTIKAYFRKFRDITYGATALSSVALCYLVGLKLSLSDLIRYFVIYMCLVYAHVIVTSVRKKK